MKRILKIALLGIFITTGCEGGFGVQSVNYAVDQVKLTNQNLIVINEHPAIQLTIENIGDSPVFNILVTVKAKMKNVDLSIQTVNLETINPFGIVERNIIFEELDNHKNYDMITLAVSYSN